MGCAQSHSASCEPRIEPWPQWWQIESAACEGVFLRVEGTDASAALTVTRTTQPSGREHFLFGQFRDGTKGIVSVRFPGLCLRAHPDGAVSATHKARDAWARFVVARTGVDTFTIQVAAAPHLYLSLDERGVRATPHCEATTLRIKYAYAD
jgi:hypothetical protein